VPSEFDSSEARTSKSDIAKIAAETVSESNGPFRVVDRIRGGTFRYSNARAKLAVYFINDIAAMTVETMNCWRAVEIHLTITFFVAGRVQVFTWASAIAARFRRPGNLAQKFDCNDSPLCFRRFADDGSAHGIARRYWLNKKRKLNRVVVPIKFRVMAQKA